MSKKRSLIAATLFLAVCFLSLWFYAHTHQSENERFNAYTYELFCQEVSGNTITLHYTLKDPSSHHIKQAPVTYGMFSTDSAAICAGLENTRAVLHSYDQSQLSKENCLTYEVLDDYLNCALAESAYTLYNEPLAPMTGTQSQLPILLSEYQFYSQKDIDTYLELLTKTPEYFQSLLDFERAKSKSGLFMSAEAADAIISECQDFISMGEQNYLLSSFAERLGTLSLSDEETAEYIRQNSDYVNHYIFPAYASLSDGLKALRDTGTNPKGLCYFPEGKDYYEALVRAETGSGKTIQELQALTVSQMQTDLTDMQRAMTSLTDTGSIDSGVLSDIQSVTLTDANPSSILSTLAAKTKQHFPELSSVNTQIKYVQESMEAYLSPAFYMIPPLDNSMDNVIYINPGHLSNDLSLFTTLAHEGYPGHLYQTVYYASQNPDPIRLLLGFGGYTEGWATYSEMLSYYYIPIPTEQATILQKNASMILGLYALADMGIHYDGWTLTDTITFFQSYGITDVETIQSIYQLILSDPANYLKYYIGYVEFLELKKEAITDWGEDFTQKRFHKAVLDIGPAGFDVLHDSLFQP